MTPRAATVAEIPNTSAVRAIRDRALRSIVLAWCNGIVSPSWRNRFSSALVYSFQSVAGELPARLYAGASTMIGSEAVCLDSVKCASDKCKRRNKDLAIWASCLSHTHREVGTLMLAKQASRYFNNAEKVSKWKIFAHLRARCTPGQMEIAELFKSLLLRPGCVLKPLGSFSFSSMFVD